MALDLADYDRRARDAVKVFWRSRVQARERQAYTGLPDQGERGSVTGGKNMDGFINLVVDLVRANGLRHASIHRKVSLLTLPGYFRPTKRWDLLVLDESHLVAAIELKSQVGPSFGNNFNNRAEEAVGSATDLWTAYREGAFGDQARPFVGWLILVEDAPASRRPVRCETPHFPVFPAFEGASYLKRYDLLCRRLVRERLYTTAAVISSPRSAAETGEYRRQSEMTGIVPPISLDSSLATHPGSKGEEARDVSEYGRAGFGEEPREAGFLTPIGRHRPPGAVKFMWANDLTATTPEDRCQHSVSRSRSHFKGVRAGG